MLPRRLLQLALPPWPFARAMGQRADVHHRPGAGGLFVAPDGARTSPATRKLTMTNASHPICIAGPTAAGKSDIALALAEKIGGEIISVDSMQVYRGLDIGTAKPDAATQKRIRHHLIDVCYLNEPFDAAKFILLASRAVADIQSRSK